MATPGLKSESTATMLTLAGVATPFLLTALTYEPDTDNPMYVAVGFMSGLVLPAAGHWYTRRIGTYGILMRFGALVVFGTGLSYLDDADRCARGEPVTDGCHRSDRTVGKITMGAGIAAWVGSWAYDVMSARLEVRRYNERRRLLFMPLTAQHTLGIAIGGEL